MGGMDASSVLAGIALAVSLLSLGGIAGAFLHANGAVKGAQRAMQLATRARHEARQGDASALAERLATLELRIEELPLSWEVHEAKMKELKDHADRQYSRARAVQSAQERKDREREGIEWDEDEEFPDYDGRGGAGEGLPPVPDRVGAPTPAGGQVDLTNPWVLAQLEI